MRIDRIEDLHANAGWRNVSFVKMTTADGIVGWSEYRADAGNAGVTGVIRELGRWLVGTDPRELERAAALLAARTVQAPGGINQHAIAALLNAAIDIKAKALGVPVAALYGGPVRREVDVYWSHCGSYRLRHAAMIGVDPVVALPDVVALGEQVRRQGFRALKTSVLPLVDGTLRSFGPGFGWTPGAPALTLDPGVVDSVVRLLDAFRTGAGPDVGLMLDLNCHFRTEGFLRLVRALDDHRLDWLEIDAAEPAALATIRRASRCPIASCELLYGRRALKPWLDAQAVDVAIVDVNWNGFVESMKMAVLADTYDVNVATHNYGGCLGESISAQFAAAIPNLQVMEYDVDDVPWAGEFVTHPLEISAGRALLTDRPGWGTDVDEAALRRHPPK